MRKSRDFQNIANVLFEASEKNVFGYFSVCLYSSLDVTPAYQNQDFAQIKVEMDLCIKIARYYGFFML